VGRGELGFVMAEEAYRNGLTSKLTFSVTVWALLLATLLSPIAFRRSLAAHHHHHDHHDPSSTLAWAMDPRVAEKSSGGREVKGLEVELAASRGTSGTTTTAGGCASNSGEIDDDAPVDLSVSSADIGVCL
jgi:hypothetical protein